jgi:histidyl-tRNA synthetase
LQAEQSYKKNPKMLSQLQYCEEQSVPYALVIGESELEQGIVKLRTIATREEVDIPRDQLISEIKTRLQSTTK